MKKGLSLSAVSAFLFTMLSEACEGQYVPLYYDVSPGVIEAGQSEPVVVTIAFSALPERVELDADWEPGDQQWLFRDDGVTPDTVSGDGIFSLRLEASEIFSQPLAAGDVFKRFASLRVLQGGAQVVLARLTFLVATDALPPYDVLQLAPDLQATRYVVNIVRPNAPSSCDASVARRFYQSFPDVFDFLNVVWHRSHFLNPTHCNIQNTVQGIGLGLFSTTAEFGSAGRLLGLNNFPHASAFDGAGEVLQHEIAHQWINFADFPPFDCCIPHWPISTLANGILGNGVTRGGVGSSAACRLTATGDGIRLLRRQEPSTFTDMDLYLMGLVAGDQVGRHFVARPQGLNEIRRIQASCDGRLYDGEVDELSLGDLTQKLGSRKPDVANSRKIFRLATVVVSRRLLSQRAMDYYSFFAARAESLNQELVNQGNFAGLTNPFSLSTFGLGRLEANVTDQPASKCTRDADTACLQSNRFEVEVGWETGSSSGAAQVMNFGGQRTENDESVFFWFFSPTNFEMAVKVLDACGPALGNRYWVFISGLTNQGWRVRVRDTSNGAVKTYTNAVNHLSATFADTDAFRCD